MNVLHAYAVNWKKRKIHYSNPFTMQQSSLCQKCSQTRSNAKILLLICLKLLACDADEYMPSININMIAVMCFGILS